MVWLENSNSWNFFSPTNYIIIRECVFEKDFSGSNKKALYEKILKIPFPLISEKEIKEKDLKVLIKDIASDNLDRFFYYYLCWYTINTNFDYRPFEE